MSCLFCALNSKGMLGLFAVESRCTIRVSLFCHCVVEKAFVRVDLLAAPIERAACAILNGLSFEAMCAVT